MRIEKRRSLILGLFLIFIFMNMSFADEKKKEQDKVTITKGIWIPNPHRKWRVIVKARTDAKPGTVSLEAHIISKNKVIRSARMEYDPTSREYTAIFFYVKTRPELILVKSTGGGSAEMKLNE